MSNRDESELAQAVCHLAQSMESLAHSMCEFGGVIKDEMSWRRSHECPATRSDLQEMEKRLMTAFEEIGAYLDEQKKYNEEDAVRITAIREDIKNQTDRINELLATAGLTPALREKIAALKTAGQKTTADLKELDEVNPPVVPAPPTDPNPPTEPL